MHGENGGIADRLDEVARLLEEQGANPFRVRAYARAAETVRALARPIRELYHVDGLSGLEALDGIGPGLARALQQLITEGRLPMLERLRGEHDPIALLNSVPGIGESLAQRLHDELGIHTLEQLELAAHDGRLARVPGIGPKRLAGIRDAVRGRLPPRRPTPAAFLPPVAELLDVDREYRERGTEGRLRRIAPSRLNPGGTAWLPILHTSRGDRAYTALFSNTARAHRLKKTRDWVVIYVDADGGEQQYTVVTGTTGALRGRRLVRGRERECLQLYEPSPVTAPRATAGVR